MPPNCRGLLLPMEISSHHNRWQWLNMLWPGEDTEREEGTATREGTGTGVGARS